MKTTWAALSFLSVAVGFSLRPEPPAPLPPPRVPFPDHDVAPPGAVGLEGIISAASHLCAVPAEILRELFRVESGFDPLAVSTAGAVGLGQLMPATARFMGVKDSKDPYQNAVGSACYLASLKGNGTWRDALLSYGFGNLPKGREASTYADTILLGNDK